MSELIVFIGILVVAAIVLVTVLVKLMWKVA